jgi:hypothetical protein
MADDAQNALCALREATAALRHATGRRPVRGSGLDEAELIADLATNLEALAALVRTTGLESIPTTAASHDLLAVVQGVTATASMARGMTRLDGHHAAPRLVTSQPASVAPDD